MNPRGQKASDARIIPVLAAVIFNDRGEVLLAKRRGSLSNPGKWEFPGGKLRPGENPQDCLKREIEEELGIQIAVDTLFEIVNHPYPDKNILLIAYLCQFQSGHFRLIDHDEVQWVSLENLSGYDLSDADKPIADKLMEKMGMRGTQ